MGSQQTGIIDAHVHLYPAEVSRNPREWAVRMNEPLWGALVEPREARRVRQGWADCDQLLHDMDAAGVERAVLLGWYWEQHATCVWHNRYHADCIKKHSERLWAFATVQAAVGAAAIDEMKRAADVGMIGLGETCPPAVGGSYSDPNWMRVWEQALELNWPVNLHVTDPAARPFPGRVETSLVEIVGLAARLPELRLILAHWGGGLIFHELNPYCRHALRNACYDTAASSLIYDSEVFSRAVAAVGAEKIIFGSDYPLLTHPAREPEPGFATAIEGVRRTGLSNDESARILGGNSRSLLNRG